MSHDIETREGKASAFFVGNKAWHNLGTMFDVNNPPKTALEAMMACNADWEVELFPTFTDIGEESMIEVPGRFAVVRDVDKKIIGNVGGKYTPLQNKEAFNFFNPFILDNQATFEAGGVLGGGAKVWALAKINEGADGEVIDNDVVNTYLLLFNSHDGSTSVGVMFTPVRVVCQNTLTMATSNFKASNLVKIPHTKSIHDSLELVQRTIDTARKTFTVTLEQYRLMQEKTINVEGLAQFASAAILPGNKTVDMNELPRVVKKVIEFNQEGVGQDIPGVQGTLWGAYNAVTGFVDHVRGRSPETRLEASWFGEGKKIRERAHDLAVNILAGNISV